MVYLIDRRPNDRGKSAVNRERFLRRYKTHIQEAVKKMVGDRRLADMESGGEVRVPKKDMSEPSFNFGRGGDREFVLPGNREYVAGDRIPRPEGGGGGGGGNDGGEGESQDEFVFSLSREEFMQIFFDDLELPRLARTEFGRTHRHKSIRAGFAKTGVPANLAVIRTMTQALARRIALCGGLARETLALQEAFAVAAAVGESGRGGRDPRGTRSRGTAAQRNTIPGRSRPALSQSGLAAGADRAGGDVLPDGRIGVDGRGQEGPRQALLRAAVSVPPRANTRKWTWCSSAIPMTRRKSTRTRSSMTSARAARSCIRRWSWPTRSARERYAHGWNVYAAQASDGDAFGADPARSARFLRERLLPASRYYTYLELTSPHASDRPSALWAEYERLSEPGGTFAMRRAASRDQIYPVFRELFRKEAQ